MLSSSGRGWLLTSAFLVPRLGGKGPNHQPQRLSQSIISAAATPPIGEDWGSPHGAIDYAMVVAVSSFPSEQPESTEQTTVLGGYSFPDGTSEPSSPTSEPHYTFSSSYGFSPATPPIGRDWQLPDHGAIPRSCPPLPLHPHLRQFLSPEEMALEGICSIIKSRHQRLLLETHMSQSRFRDPAKPRFYSLGPTSEENIEE